MKKLYIIGIGPGDQQFMTKEADYALNECDVICGYNVYVDLVKDFYPNKELLQTGMTKEVDRCVQALDQASLGKTVAMVCSGDSAIYGMASLVLQLANKVDDNTEHINKYSDIEIIVVAGVTAAISGGAVLGSPLTNDFAVVSLSDLLTPMEVITRRIEAVGIGDFVAVIYNPYSKKRTTHLYEACQILLKHRPEETVCGYVKNIGRAEQSYKILTLKELAEEKLDMFTTVFVGNSQTKLINGKMVTSRGYEKKSTLV